MNVGRRPVALVLLVAVAAAVAVAGLVAALAAPAVAEAAEAGASPSAVKERALAEAARAWRTLALFAGIVFTAFLLNRFARSKRVHMRRTIFLFAAHAVAFLLAKVLHYAGAHAWDDRIAAAANLFAGFVLVSLVAVLVFDLIVPRLRGPTPSIVADLAVGGGYLVVIIATLSSLGVNATGLLTTSAVVTAIIGLSLQKTLGNILGGVALQLDNSISVGDWIKIGDGPEGRVAEIHWRHTVVETRNWDTLIIPNATLLDSTIAILGKRSGDPVPHRMWIYFDVDYRYPPTQVMGAVNEALQAAPIENVAAEPKPHCICFDFARDRHTSMAYYAVRYWLTDLARDDPTSSVVRTRIYSALKRAGIPLALPAQAVFLTADDEGHKERHRLREARHRVEALSGVEIFRSLSEEELEKLAARLKYAPFTAGETMTRQGAVAHWLYILTSGEAEVRVRGPDGLEETVARLRAPTFFGEMALLTGEPRTSTVIATSEAECYRLDRDGFQQIVQERPGIAAEVSAIVARRRVELDSAREHLDHEAKERRVQEKTGQLLGRISAFFGLNEDKVRMQAYSTSGAILIPSFGLSSPAPATPAPAPAQAPGPVSAPASPPAHAKGAAEPGKTARPA